MRAALICPALVLAVSFGASAQETQGENQGFFLGAGIATCLELTNHTNEYEVPTDLLPWIKGFWSGLNMAKGAADKSDVDLSVPAANDDIVEQRIYAECYADGERRVYSVALQIYFEFPPAITNQN